MFCLSLFLVQSRKQLAGKYYNCPKQMTFFWSNISKFVRQKIELKVILVINKHIRCIYSYMQSYLNSCNPLNWFGFKLQTNIHRVVFQRAKFHASQTLWPQRWRYWIHHFCYFKQRYPSFLQQKKSILFCNFITISFPKNLKSKRFIFKYLHYVAVTWIGLYEYRTSKKNCHPS